MVCDITSCPAPGNDEMFDPPLLRMSALINLSCQKNF